MPWRQILNEVLLLLTTMDIDDILAEVDGNVESPETCDLQALTRAWVIERSAPELLPWPEALMERVLERIRKQVGTWSASRLAYQETSS